MSVDRGKLYQAMSTFTAHPTASSAAMFFSVLREAEQDGLATDDEWLNGCAEIEAYLWKASE